MGFVPPTGAGGQGPNVIPQPSSPVVPQSTGTASAPNPNIPVEGGLGQPPVGWVPPGSVIAPSQAPPGVPIMTPQQAVEYSQAMGGALPAGWETTSDGATVYREEGVPVMTPNDAYQIMLATGQYPPGWVYQAGSTNPWELVYVGGSGGTALTASRLRRINSDVLDPLGAMMNLL
jgi:hypothetical protein